MTNFTHRLVLIFSRDREITNYVKHSLPFFYTLKNKIKRKSVLFTHKTFWGTPKYKIQNCYVLIQQVYKFGMPFYPIKHIIQNPELLCTHTTYNFGMPFYPTNHIIQNPELLCTHTTYNFGVHFYPTKYKI